MTILVEHNKPVIWVLHATYEFIKIGTGHWHWHNLLNTNGLYIQFQDPIRNAYCNKVMEIRIAPLLVQHLIYDGSMTAKE